MAVAADSGADRLLAAGVMPDAVLGDFNSISAAAQAGIPRRAGCIPRPNRTAAISTRRYRAIEAPLILAVGFTDRAAGSRAGGDERAGPAAAPALHRDRPKDIAFAAPPRLSLRLRPGDPLSLFPLARVAAASEGLHWPLDGLDFAPWGMIGTSNRVTAAGWSCPRPARNAGDPAAGAAGPGDHGSSGSRSVVRSLCASRSRWMM